MAIETTPSTLSPSTPSVFDSQAERPRPQDVGILGIEMYFPQRVSYYVRHLPYVSSHHLSVHFRGGAGSVRWCQGRKVHHWPRPVLHGVRG
jgi:hypothetical protein